MMTPIRVLYVDDEPDLLRIGRIFLEQSGDFTVTTIGSAPAALDLLQHEKFDVIISDYQMPEIDGIQFLAEVRARYGPIPFILFTGRGREEVVIQAINSGVDFYLQKGGDPGAQFAELSHKVRMAVERCTIDTALQESEKKYRRIVETAHEGIWALDDQFVTTYVNERMADMLGYSAEEMLGKKYQFFMPEEELADLQVKTRERRRRQPDSYERQFRASDGKNRTFHVTATPVTGDDGSFQGSFAMLTDITERKEAAEALRKSEEKYRILLDESSDPIFSFYPDGTYRYVNLAFATGVGKPLDQIIGKKIWDVFEKSEAEKRFSALREVFSTGAGKEFEVRVPHPEGDRYFVTTVVPVKDESGSVISANCSAKDITERKRAEDALRESNVRYDQLAIQGGIITWEVDTGGLYTYVSHVSEAVWGYRPDEMVGLMHFYDLHPEAGREAFKEACFAIFKRREPFRDVENAVLAKGDKMVWVSTNGFPHLNADGTLKGYRGSDTDITRRKEAEKALIHSRDLMRYIIEHNRSAIAVHDRDLKYIYVSQPYLQEYKLSESEVIGRHHYEVFPDLPKRWKDVHQKALSGEISSAEDDPFVREDGTVVWTRWECRPWYESDGSIGGIIIYTEVITKRKQVEEALKESENLFRTLLNGANDEIFLHDVLPDGKPGRYTLVNSLACQRLGYTAEELLEMSPRDIVPPEHLAKIPDIARMIQHEGHGKFGAIHRSKDGSEFPVEVSTTIFEFHGNKMGLSIARDLTEQKVAEEALRKSKEEYRTIADFTYDWEYWVDPEGKFIYVSPSCERITGYRPEEFMQDPDLLVAITHIDDRYQVVDHISHRDYISSEHYALEFRIISKNGGMRWIGHECQPVFSPSGEYLGNRGSNRDITERKVAQERLKESEKNLAYAQKIARMGSYHWNLQTDREIAFSDQMYEIFDLSKDEKMSSALLMSRIHPDDREVTQQILLEKMNNKTRDQHYDFRIVRENGEVRHIEVNAETIFDDNGKPCISVGTVQDITERKQAEDLIRKNEERYRLVVENAGEAIVIAQGDRLVYANPKTREMLGTTSENLLNRPFTNYLHPDDRVLVFDRYQRRVKGDEVPDDYDFRLISTTGEVTWVHITSVRIEWDNKPATLNFLIDINERKREEALKKSEELLNLAIIGSGVGLWDWNIQTSETVFNERWADIVGYTLKELEPVSIETWSSLAHPDDLARSNKILEKHFTGELPEYECETRMRHKNGLWVWVLDRGRVTRWDNDGKPLRMTGTHLDITRRKDLEMELEYHEQVLLENSTELSNEVAERRRIEEEIKELNQELESRVRERTEELAKTVRELMDENAERQHVERLVHLMNAKLSLMNDVTYQDIQNKVTALRGFVELIQNAKTDEERRVSCEKEKTLLENIHNLIKKTKDYQKLGVGKVQWLDVEKTIRRIRLPPGSRVSLNIDIHDIRIYSDPLIAQVFDILAGNAVTHGEKTTCISFSCQKTRDGITIICEDDGVGILPGDKAHIFDRVVAGEGKFGLFFVREFLTLSGMTITETGEPGKGARFEMMVPKGMCRVAGKST